MTVLYNCISGTETHTSAITVLHKSLTHRGSDFKSVISKLIIQDSVMTSNWSKIIDHINSLSHQERILESPAKFGTLFEIPYTTYQNVSHYHDYQTSCHSGW